MAGDLAELTCDVVPRPGHSDGDRVPRLVVDEAARNAESMPAPGGIMFVGSSSIQFWSTLSEDTAPLPVIVPRARAPSLRVSGRMTEMMRSGRARLPNRALFGVSFAALLVIAGSATAQTWEVEYDASLGTLPSAQGFGHFAHDPLPDDGLTEGNYGVASNILTQGDTGGPNTDPGNRQWYELTSETFDFDVDTIVVDLDLKILFSTLTAPGQPTPGAGFAVELVDEDGEQVIFYVGSAGFFLYGTSGQTSPILNFDSTADFEDYQLRIDTRGAWLRVKSNSGTSNHPEWWTWSQLDRADFGTSVSANVVQIGDASTLESSSSELRSFGLSRFTPSVAEVRNYQLVPPATLPPDSERKIIDADCPANSLELGGGATVDDGTGSAGLSGSLPIGDPFVPRWRGVAHELLATPNDWQLFVHGICGEVSGREHFSNYSGHAMPQTQGATMMCQPEKNPISGGADDGGQFSGPNPGIVGTSPDGNPSSPRGWLSVMNDFAYPTGIEWGVKAFLICSDASGYDYVTKATVSDSSSPKFIDAPCPEETVAISGGARAVDALQETALFMTEPVVDIGGIPIAWRAGAQEFVPTTANWYLEANVICAPIADPTVTKAGMLGRWKGNTNPADAKGTADGVLQNGVTYAPGVFDDAFSFDGVSDQWVEIPGDDFYPASSFTADAWIQTSALSPDGQTAIVNVYDSGGTNPGGANPSAWTIRLDASGFPLGTIRDSFGSSSTLVGPASVNLVDGLPHHVAMVRDSEDKKLRLYVDGVLEGEESINTNVNDGPLTPGGTNPDPLAIGAWRKTAGTVIENEFNGEIDDVKYFDRALTAEEIQNIAGCGVPVVPRTLNLEAALFGGLGPESVLCVYLEAGNYELTLTNPGLDPDARFTAWSAEPDEVWGTSFSVVGDVFAGTTGGMQPDGIPPGASSPQQAYDWTVPKETYFTLTVDQKVYISLDDPVGGKMLDNRGGISLRLVPEPSFLTGFGAGAALLVLLSRSKRAQR